jgi:D-alanyl-D-alanine carboxypeptidase/D-alanyl-D-alanine-endopeptidase (penicillin-binding protein 4)
MVRSMPRRPIRPRTRLVCLRPTPLDESARTVRLPTLFDLDRRTRTVVLGVLVGVTVLLLALAAVLQAGSEDGAAPQPSPSAAVPDLDPERVVLPAAALDTGEPAGAAGVAAALRPILGDAALGGVGAVVLDGADGAVLYDDGAAVARISASTVKALTTAAVLDALGPDHRFSTAVVAPGISVSPSAAAGGATPSAAAGAQPLQQLVLVGGGDPVLAADDTDALPGGASLESLAARTAAQLRAAGVTGPVTIGFDAGLFTGPAISAGWRPALLASGIVQPVSALTVLRDPDTDTAVADPSRRAAVRFAAALRDAGVPVSGDPTPARAPAGAAALAAVESPVLSAVVEHTLEVSDNDAAEILARHVGLAAGGQGSFADSLPAIVARLSDLGVPTAGTSLDDGSGLSRSTVVPPATVAGAVARSLQQPRLSAVAVGMPVAGFTGTLAERFDQPDAVAGRGDVRAKTGTLTGVSSLAGTVRTADGRVLVFAFLADEVAGGTEAARDLLDSAAAALAACGC